MKLAILIVTIIFSCISAKAEVVHLDLHNTVTFRGEVTEDLVLFNMMELNRLDIERGAGKYPIYIVLDSPGGSIIDGINFIQFAKSIKNVKTIVIFAASMAAVIAENLPGERLITDTGIIMFHRAKGGFQGQFEDGEVESRLELAKRIVRGLEQANANRMGISLVTYKNMVKDELWLVGPDAVAQSAEDKVVSIECSKELIDAGIIEEGLLGSVAFSKCPLYRTPIPVPDSKKTEVAPNEAYVRCDKNNRI